jgi:hypothetical protein
VSDLPPARVLEVSPDAYHKLPGFSASLAKICVRQSIAHAKDAHDLKMERIAEEDETDEEITDEKQAQLDRGTILHALVLGKGESRLQVIPDALLSGKHRSYSSAEAKAARDGARKAGRVPVKELKMPSFKATAGRVSEKIAAAGHILDGRSEFAIEWWEPTPHGPVMCRCMMDHVVVSDAEPPFSGAAPWGVIYELKMVGDAHPERCQRTAENLGYGIAAAAYPRALAALYPRLAGRITHQFLFCETRRPYALWDPPRLSGAFRELGERRWLRAVYAWAELQATGRAPSYREQGHDEITAPMYVLDQEGFPRDDR